MDSFIAQVMLFAGGYAPKGWAFCDGQTLPISGNESLFSLIGTTYGGDGRTTFALPDLRGRVPVHAGQGPGLTRRVLGQKFGDEAVVTDDVEIQPRRTEATAANISSNDSNVIEGMFGHAKQYTDVGSPAIAYVPPGMEANGGGHSYSEFQPSLCLNYIICISGIYPPRS